MLMITLLNKQFNKEIYAKEAVNVYPKEMERTYRYINQEQVDFFWQGKGNTYFFKVNGKWYKLPFCLGKIDNTKTDFELLNYSLVEG